MDKNKLNNNGQTDISFQDCSYYKKLIVQLKTTGIKICICLLPTFLIAIIVGQMSLGQIFSSTATFFTGDKVPVGFIWVVVLGFTLYFVGSVIVLVRKKYNQQRVARFFGTLAGLILMPLVIDLFISIFCPGLIVGLGSIYESVSTFVYTIYLLAPFFLDILFLIYLSIRLVIEFNVSREDAQKAYDTSRLNLENNIKKLNQLIGLEKAKSEIHNILDIHNASKQLGGQGVFSNDNRSYNNLVFVGPVGTEKLTVANLLTKIYKELGIIRSGVFVSCRSKELVGETDKDTFLKTQYKLNEALGGVLFIDDAYNLAKTDETNNLGKEALETIIKFVQNNKERIIVIVSCCSDEEMNTFLGFGPELSSMFERKVHFEDYSADELYQIFELYATSDKLKIEEESYVPIKKLISSQMRTKDFNNSFGVEKIYRKIKEQAKQRLSKLNFNNLNKDEIDGLMTIKKVDVESLSLVSPSTEKSAKSAQSRLNELIGLGSVKQQIQDIIVEINYDKFADENNLKVNRSVSNNLNMVFYGPAGTGKSTVAKLMGEILNELGVLKKGHLQECGRKDLVGEYVGHTAPKTQEQIDDAIDGVLFIDEAYSLTAHAGSNNNDFGQEAITTLIHAMNDHKSDLVVIVAGYKKEMDEFLESNEGLASRFPNKIYFEDYSPDEMVKIFQLNARKEGYSIEENCYSALKNLFEVKSSEKNFGNARGVENIYKKVILNLKKRLDGRFVSPLTEKEKQILTTIVKEDITKLLN